MYIIDKNKDYYDYYSHLYGVDKSITFDRRGSRVIDDSAIIFISHKRQIDKNSTTHVLLEIGNLQYLIKLSNFLSIIKYGYEEFVSSKMEVVKLFSDNKHYYDSPISIRGVYLKSHWHWYKRKLSNQHLYENPFNELILESLDNHAINLPILGGTKITSLIDGKEIWIALNTYFSSLKNDKSVDIKITDVEKAEIHGFDKKTSFRHPVK